MRRHGWCGLLLAACALAGCQQPTDVGPSPAATPADFVQQWAQDGEVTVIARCGSAGQLTTLTAGGQNLLVIAAGEGLSPADLLTRLLRDASDRAHTLGQQNLILRFNMDRESAELLLASRLPIQVMPVTDQPMSGRIVMALK